MRLHSRPSVDRQSDNLLKEIENPSCPNLTGRTAAYTDTPCPVPLPHPSDACGISLKVVCGGRVLLFDWHAGEGGLREVKFAISMPGRLYSHRFSARLGRAVRSVAASPQCGGTAAPGRVTVPKTLVFCNTSRILCHKATVFCDSALLSHHRTFGLHGVV